MLNLKKLKSTAFDDIEILLDKLNISYETFGPNIYCNCPIHEGSDNSRGFSISTDKQIWKCWTRGCEDHYSNDVFGLIQGILSRQQGEEVSFSEALKFICKTLKIKDNYVSEKINKEEPDDFVQLVHLFAHNSNYDKKHSCSINNNKYNTQESEYFMSRGFNSSTLEYFGVGDCHDRNSKMYQRAVIPIFSDDGVLISHMGRSIREYRKPKFLFTEGFDKRFFLYNYHRAIKMATNKSCLFLTEGQGDVWKLFESGVENAVGIFGKSLTRQQEQKILDSGITRIVVLTDNDQAGREAKLKIARKLNRHFTVMFPIIKGRDLGCMDIKQIQNNVLPQVRGLY